MTTMTTTTRTRTLLPHHHHQEPGWRLEREGSALLLRRDVVVVGGGGVVGQQEQQQQQQRTRAARRVCFRCDVEVREYERDEDYGYCAGGPGGGPEAEPAEVAASPLAMCASCLAAICVTVVLPWLLIGG